MKVFAASAAGTTFHPPMWLLPLLFFCVPLVIVLVTLYVRRRALAKRPPREAEEKSFPVGCLFSFASLFIVAGLATSFFVTVRPTYRSMQASHWPTTQGSVTSSKLGISRGNKGGLSYRVDIHYRYAVAGHDYESNQYDATGTSTFSGYREQKQAVVKAHRPGTPVTVYHNPADPADAMLSTAIPPGTFAFVWFPILFCTVPPGMVYMMFRASRNAGKPRVAKPAKIAAAATDGRRKRRRDFLLLLVFALFWNGFITFFWLETRGGWITLFLIPFVAVGIVLAVAAGHQLLTLFNPLVSVSFSRMPIHPGETCDVAFAVQGNVFNMSLLSFKLEGREKVTFNDNEGKSRFETTVVYVFPLMETTKNYEMEKGRFIIKLPADVMTSFATTSTAFSWHLVCHGESPRRPNIKDEFDVTVLSKSS